MTAYLVLKKVFFDDAFLNMAMKKIKTSHLSEQNLAYVTRLTNSVLENLNQIDYAYAPLIYGKRVHTSVRIILRMAVCEMLFLNTPDRAAINEAVNLTENIGKKPLKGFVNAVLRKFSQTKDQIEYPNIEKDLVAYLKVFSGYPEWLIHEVIESYGEAFAKDFLLYRQKTTDQTHVRANTLISTIDDAKRVIKSEGLLTESDEWFDDGFWITHLTDIENRAAYQQGQMTVMGAASMLSVCLSDVSKDMRVLDACAAPGGKTAYLATKMENTGKILAWDVHAHRVDLINKNLSRLGVSNVTASVQDATVYDPTYNGQFDLVFLDMPCSSLGLAYRKHDIKRIKTEKDIASLQKLQKQILNNAKNYVKPGGTMMVVTCSVTQAESDLAWFFKQNKNFDEQAIELPKHIEAIKRPNGIQLFPHLSKMDGFFVCKIKRQV